jgi:methionyl aminopeptidase
MNKGLVICIEPMINLGKRNVKQMQDGWTIKTADGKPSAHFEYAVAVGKEEADVLTTFEFIDEVLDIK